MKKKRWENLLVASVSCAYSVGSSQVTLRPVLNRFEFQNVQLGVGRYSLAVLVSDNLGGVTTANLPVCVFSLCTHPLLQK